MKNFLIISILSYATMTVSFAENKQPPLPHYSVITNSQFKCDSSEMDKIPWNKTKYRDVWKLAYKTISIVDEFSITEEKRIHVNPKITEPTRSFTISFKPYARIFCGSKYEIHSTNKVEIDKPFFRYSSQTTSKIDFSDDNNSENDTSYLSYTESNDAKNPPGLDGLSCLVSLEDFVKDPLKAVNVNKLCKGENKKQIEKTQKAILELAQKLKEKNKK